VHPIMIHPRRVVLAYMAKDGRAHTFMFRYLFAEAAQVEDPRFMYALLRDMEDAEVRLEKARKEGHVVSFPCQRENEEPLSMEYEERQMKCVCPRCINFTRHKKYLKKHGSSVASCTCFRCTLRVTQEYVQFKKLKTTWELLRNFKEFPLYKSHYCSRTLMCTRVYQPCKASKRIEPLVQLAYQWHFPIALPLPKDEVLFRYDKHARRLLQCGKLASWVLWYGAVFGVEFLETPVKAGYVRLMYSEGGHHEFKDPWYVGPVQTLLSISFFSISFYLHPVYREQESFSWKKRSFPVRRKRLRPSMR